MHAPQHMLTYSVDVLYLTCLYHVEYNVHMFYGCERRMVPTLTLSRMLWPRFLNRNPPCASGQLGTQHRPLLRPGTPLQYICHAYIQLKRVN